MSQADRSAKYTEQASFEELSMGELTVHSVVGGVDTLQIGGDSCEREWHLQGRWRIVTIDRRPD